MKEEEGHDCMHEAKWNKLKGFRKWLVKRNGTNRRGQMACFRYFLN